MSMTYILSNDDVYMICYALREMANQRKKQATDMKSTDNYNFRLELEAEAKLHLTLAERLTNSMRHRGPNEQRPWGRMGNLNP